MPAMFLVLTAALVFAAQIPDTTAEIHPDWAKLTDFSTKYTLTRFQDDPQYPEVVVNEANGEINVDVFGQKALIKSRASFTLARSGSEGHAAIELFFDGVNGRVALKFQGTIPEEIAHNPGGVTIEPSCVKIRLSQGMLPPPDMIKEHFEQSKPMITQDLNMAPHKEVSVDGKPAYLYSEKVWSSREPSSYSLFAIRDDATPVGASEGVPNVPDAGADWTPDVKFADWHQGASIPDDVTCTEMSPEELLAKPYAKQLLQSLDDVVAYARRMRPLQLAFEHLPAKPSLFLEFAAGTGHNVEASMPGTMTVLVLAFAAGTLASILVVAVSKSRHSQGTRCRTPLLENVA